jgi:hypothetical protein
MTGASLCTLPCRDCPVCECDCEDGCTLDCHEIGAANWSRRANLSRCY